LSHQTHAKSILLLLDHNLIIGQITLAFVLIRVMFRSFCINQQYIMMLKSILLV